MPTLPEGVLTLFFSDVEGSTRLAKSHGDVAWAEMLETHRRLLREAFAAHGGIEVDTQGDSFFAVFRMASNALAAALSAQQALAAQAWPQAGAVRDARREAAAACEMACSAQSSQLRMSVEMSRAWMETALGDLSAAVRWWRALITSSDAQADEPWTLSVALAGLAATLHVMGRHDDALRTASRFMALPSQGDTTLAMTSVLAVEVAPVLVAGAQHEAANRLLRDALRDARRFGILMADGQALSMVGIAEHLRGRPQRAGRLLAASRQVKGAEMPNGFRSATGALLYVAYLPQVRAALGPDEARRARAEGQAMTLDEAMAYALEGLG